MKPPLLWVAFTLVALGALGPSRTAAANDVITTYDATVVDDATLVFESPSRLANVVRQLYVGEIVQVFEELVTDDGRRWCKLALGFDAAGYVETAQLARTKRLQAIEYRPRRVAREELPVAVGLRFGAESLGSAVVLRYQRFSRLGAYLSLGTSLASPASNHIGLASFGDPTPHGLVWSGGVTSFLVLWGLSPVLEMGLSRVSYSQGAATLEMTNMQITVGLEWMFDRGWFGGLSATYVRSLGVSVDFDYDDAGHRALVVPDFGALDPGDDGVFESLQPGLIVGYAF